MTEGSSETDTGAVFENALERLESLRAELDPVESLEDVDDETLEALLGDVDALVTVATELEEVFDALDLEQLPEAVDGDELLEAIDASEVPAALSDDERGVGDVVDFGQVVKAIDLLSAWNATDLTAIWEETQDLEEAVYDLANDEDGGLAATAASAVTDEEGGGLVGDDGILGGEENGDGLLGGGDELLEDVDERLEGVDPTDALGSIDVDENPEAYQVFIQQQAMAGIDEFRDALLKTHGKFETLYELNREKMRRQDTSTSSRNPTAVSTIPTDRRDLGGGARYSTVPRKVKYSTAPARDRIYGRRFELERKRRGYDDD
ncbi:hypothetical protein EL22_17300 [Halostagnicola sp. A56]|uniref:hypothetical protein n=1 Tax=Halostagnicola sp. A56 TaxID=1495067 RepID=UPI00049F78BC|nr:hypothetical protein [Halostagnicola sp. A56]KDE59792.1 hypothetical protein EL22_17300 [Halostagnicola sp. A56]